MDRKESKADFGDGMRKKESSAFVGQPLGYAMAAHWVVKNANGEFIRTKLFSEAEYHPVVISMMMIRISSGWVFDIAASYMSGSWLG